VSYSQKTGDMAIGQVSFHNDKKVSESSTIADGRSQLTGTTGEERCVVAVQRSAPVGAFTRRGRPVYIQKRENVIVNRLNKTKVERQVDHEQERQERIKRENAVKRAAAAAQVRQWQCLRPGELLNFRPGPTEKG